ncbi:hypothetical protein EV217_2745 [Phyllobacterium myrsinacearum]|nr:hypothetical protein EV217_2745 [Phyllobacterium myrsinacearum]
MTGILEKRLRFTADLHVENGCFPAINHAGFFLLNAYLRGVAFHFYL